MSVLILATLVPGAFAQVPVDLESWLQGESGVATNKLIGNILSNGAVIASPSRVNPNYYYHWIRDAALAMDEVVSLGSGGRDRAERDRYLGLLLKYLDFSLGNQVTENPSSASGRGLGEPKFHADGSAYREPWGRPQDDGPALRALTFTRLANLLLDEGRADRVDLVKTKLYDGALPTRSVIKRDLEYVSHNWEKTGFDPWEEVSGHHFYTRIVQRKALIEGAKLAARLDNRGAAGWYSLQARSLEDAIRAHWDQGRGYLVATRDQDGGVDYKSSGLDTSVLLGVLHARTPDDDFFAPTDDMVLATAQRLASTFDAIYAINDTKRGLDGGRLGVAIGRYPEDRYGGYDGTSEGNPWVLSTAAMAELDYRIANDWESRGRIAISDRNRAFITALNPATFSGLQPGRALSPGDPEFADVLAALRSAGDAELRRIQFHSFPDGSLSEQINRDTGLMQGAADLTWNYVAILTALAQRPAPGPDPLLVGRRAAVNGAPRPGLGAVPDRGESPLGGPIVAPTPRLNRGGIPIETDHRGRPDAGAIPERTTGGVPIPGTEPGPCPRVPGKAVNGLSQDVRALRSERDRNAPAPTPTPIPTPAPR